MASSVLLVIIDDAEQRALLNRYFQSTAYHLVFAMDGEDGFDRFNEVKPNLVLLYAHVSRLDGTILCQLIRQQPRGEATPVVMMVDETSHRTEDWAKAVGADAMLQIPFERASLLSVVAPLLTNGRPPAPAKPDVIAADLAFDPTEVLGAPLTPAPPPADGDPPRRADAGDIDTVVSFQNPFYEGPSKGAAMVDPTIGESEPTPPSHGAAPVAETLAEESRPTMVHADPLTAGLSMDPERVPADRIATPTDALPPALVAPRIPDPLEEPRITLSSASSPEVSKSHLIQEVPRETTPSSSDDRRLSAIRRRAEGKERRGLDESQLGKRLAKRVRKVHGLLEEVDYYQLLGVEADASPAAIQTAYFDLSLEFHPDRFFLLRSGDLKEKIYFIYRRLHEAYRVLSDPDRRGTYDEGLGARDTRRAPSDLRGHERPETGPVQNPALDITTPSTAARPFVTKAQDAYALGDRNAARLHLYLARTLETDNHEIAAALDRVTAELAPLV